MNCFLNDVDDKHTAEIEVMVAQEVVTVRGALREAAVRPAEKVVAEKKKRTAARVVPEPHIEWRAPRANSFANSRYVYIQGDIQTVCRWANGVARVRYLFHQPVFISHPTRSP